MRIVNLLVIAGALLAAPLAWTQGPSTGSGQAYPNKPVRIIVPFLPGGAADISARILGQRFTDVWGEPVVVDNRTGAGGNIGAELAAKAEPDGYTLLMTPGAVVTANPHVYKKMTFDPRRQLVAITKVATNPQVVLAANSSQAKSVRELIEFAKAKPGSLSYGSAGIGTQAHLAVESFLHAAGISGVHVPYRGGQAAFADLIGERIQLLLPNLATAMSVITQKRVRALAVTSKERVRQLPDVPTVAETLPGFENLGWFGLMAPAGTPKHLLEKIYQQTAKSLDDADIRKRFSDVGLSTVGNSPAEFSVEIKNESKYWARIIAERGLSLQ